MFLSSCAGEQDAELTVWSAEMDEDMITVMADEFVSANRNVNSVSVVIVEDNEARTTFEGDPAAAADVICIPHDQLGALVSQNFLAEITESKYLDKIKESTTPSVKAGQIGEKQYGFPSSFETHMLFYDKSIVSDEAAQTLEGILASPLPGDGYQFAMEFGNAYFSANWFFTFGCYLFGENGEDSSSVDFDSPDGVAAMTYLINNRESFGNLNGDEAVEMFREHKLGAFIGGPWHAAAMTEALKGNYGCAMLPSVDGKPMKSFAGFKLYCVNSGSKSEAAAKDLAAWLTNSENQKTRFQERNLIPVSKILANDADLAASTTAKAVMAQGPNSIAMPSIPEMSNFWEPTGNFTLACFNGEIGIDELPDRLAELVNQITG